ncbi:hypothetical protein CF336_g5475, partial [Tilletia laevis]
MPSAYQEEEERVLCAVEEAQKSEGKINLSAIARKHNVDVQRLTRRYNGKASKSTRAPTNRKLNDTEEKVLLAWIGILDGLEISARPRLIQASADQILRDAHTDPNTVPLTVGAHWVENFIKRNPELSKVRQKSRELSRMTQDHATLLRFYERLRKVIQQHGILPDDIWNMDEVGFRVGIGGTQWIVTLCPSREAHLASETNRETVTCVEAVNATGSAISPMVIMSGIQHSESWTNNSAPGDTLLAVSDKGYSDDILALRWIVHFNNRTRRMTKGSKRLLIFDGHGSHCTKQFIDFCDQQEIIPFSLPPHSSHILQPLDVAVFQPYKHWHREAIDAATRTGCTNFSKTEFLAALNGIRMHTMKANTIKTGFRRTGIHPYDPTQVLSKYPNPTSQSSMPPPISFSTPPGSPDVPSTPRTIRTLSRSAQQIEDRYGLELSPSVSRFIRGSLQQARTGQLAVTALEAQTSVQQERHKRNERQRKVVQSGGVLYAHEAQEIAKENIEKEKREEVRREWVLFKQEAENRKSKGWRKLFTE